MARGLLNIAEVGGNWREMRKSQRGRWYVAVTLWSAWGAGLAAAWGLAAPLMAQDAPVEKCAFEGTARNSVTLLALGKAGIRLVPNNGSIGYSGFSKPDGTFLFEGMPPGDYRLQAYRTGYTDQWVLADRSGHTISTLHLAPGQVLTGTDLWFTPDGAVSGKVTGPDGEPIPSASITLIERQWRRGKRVYAGAGSETTDDAGVFRFASVPAGRYWIYAARPQRGPLALSILEAPGKPEMRIAGRYYPNAAQVDGAAAIEVRAGEEASRIDFKLPLAPVFHVAGAYAGHGEEAGVALKARYGDQTLDWAGAGASVGNDGKFDIAGVAPGAYFLYSYESSLHDRLMSAKLAVTVTAQDSAGMLAPPVARFELKGRVRVDGDAAPGQIPVRISCEGSQADDYTSYQRKAEPQSDGTFAIYDLTEDLYTIKVANLAGKDGGYYLKSLRLNGVDAAGRELDLTAGPAADIELTLGAAVGSIEGTVVRAEESPEHHAPPEPAELAVVLIPEKVASGDTQPVEAYLDPSDRFQVADLEPGSYRVFAVPRYDKGLWQNPDFVRQIAGRGVAAEVAEKATVKVDVHAVRTADLRQVEERIE
jgi:hypothetical protein